MATALFLRSPASCGSDALQFIADDGRFAIDAVGLQIVAEDAAPVGFLAVVQRVPVPVGNETGAAGDMGVGGEAELAVVGRELRARIPADGLRVGLHDEVVLHL
jgi:hypothetical protein